MVKVGIILILQTFNHVVHIYEVRTLLQKCKTESLCSFCSTSFLSKKSIKRFTLCANRRNVCSGTIYCKLLPWRTVSVDQNYWLWWDDQLWAKHVPLQECLLKMLWILGKNELKITISCHRI